MLSTLAWWPSAQSSPARTRATTLPPSMTMALASFAPGATPMLKPCTALPATVAAVCVPCSPVSCGLGTGLTSSPSASNSAKAAKTPRSAGCRPSAPVSRCATTTPLPVSPAFQSLGTSSASMPQPTVVCSVASAAMRGLMSVK